jgi:peptidoglycan hydrolase-like protein with peptidoglycan-binding domain
LGAVVSGAERDNVSLALCIVKNKFNRKSLSVHHVQRRLAELGYNDAASDKDGWYGDLTVIAVREFQGAVGLEATGLLDMATLDALFHDDANVTVTP